MSKKLAFYLWLLTPVVLFAYHYGPGQESLARDEAARQIVLAQSLEQKQDWRGAMEAYAGALAKTPVSDKSVRWKLRLAQSKARMYSGELPEAIVDMEGLLTEMQKESAPGSSLDEVRANLGAAEYYASWLMRLEGAPAAEWTVQAENARQHFRMLAEEKLKTASPDAQKYQEDLEATIRLARMDLSELQGLPLPGFCKGCKNVSQKCRSQCESQCKNPGEKPKDARSTGAGEGERPKGGS